MRQSIEALLALNALHSEQFVAGHLARRKYRALHPTEIGAFKCMDGRIHLPLMTNTPLGIIQPWRNLGGRFDLGWPFFQEIVKGWVEYSIHNGRDCIIFVTYHFSKGELHRGCRGFNYDKIAALTAARTLKFQCERVFGRTVVLPILCGIETDLDALILHGENDQTRDLSIIHDQSEDGLDSMLRELYPEMSERMRKDFLPLVQGNIAHVAEIRARGRLPADADHKEWVLAVGRGFDWLHEPNTALIVGPYALNLADAIETAALLLKSNVDEGRIQVGEKDGLVLFTSAPYRKAIGLDPGFAREKALSLQGFAYQIVANRVPELVQYMKCLTGTVDMETRKFTPIKG